MRSEWEEDIERYIRRNYPDLSIRTNDRSIIPSRNSSGNLEVDIYIPSLKLGIELNGENYHDHDSYRQDQRNGTRHSEEMYKEEYCRENGITLVNVWSSEDTSSIHATIDNKIQSKLKSVSSYSKTTSTQSRANPYSFTQEERPKVALTFAVLAVDVFFFMWSCVNIQGPGWFGAIIGMVVVSYGILKAISDA